MTTKHLIYPTNRCKWILSNNFQHTNTSMWPDLATFTHLDTFYRCGKHGIKVIPSSTNQKACCLAFELRASWYFSMTCKKKKHAFLGWEHYHCWTISKLLVNLSWIVTTLWLITNILDSDHERDFHSQTSLLTSDKTCRWGLWVMGSMRLWLDDRCWTLFSFGKKS